MSYKRISIQHSSESIQIRAALWSELKRARKNNYPLPKGVGRSIWKEPHHHEEYIWLLRFIPTLEKVTLIDIGGNSGYWTDQFLKYYPNTIVYAFEPVKEMFKQYVERFQGQPHIHIFNTALGEQAGEKLINVARDYGLTSFNQYAGELEQWNIQFENKELVSIQPLHHFITQMEFNKTIIKVDVQGFESQVIRGGMEVFNKADLAIVECSFVNEYKNQPPSFGDIVAELRQLGLHPIRFGVFDRTKGPIAFERNVLFVKEKYFKDIWL